MNSASQSGRDLHALHRQLIAVCGNGRLAPSQLVTDWVIAHAESQSAKMKSEAASLAKSRERYAREKIEAVAAAKRLMVENGGILEVRAPAGKALTVVLDLDANQNPYDAEAGRLWGYFHPFEGMESIDAAEALSRGKQPDSVAIEDYLIWKSQHFAEFCSEQEAERLRIENWRQSQAAMQERKAVLDPILGFDGDRVLAAIGKLGSLHEWIGSAHVPERRTTLLNSGKNLLEIVLAESDRGYLWVITEFDSSYPNGCVNKSVELHTPKPFGDDLAGGDGIVARLCEIFHLDRPFWRRGSGNIKRTGFVRTEPPETVCNLANELDSYGFLIEIVRDRDCSQGCRIQFHDHGLEGMWLELAGTRATVWYFDEYDGPGDFESWYSPSGSIPVNSLAKLVSRAGGDFSRVEKSETRFVAMHEHADRILRPD